MMQLTALKKIKMYLLEVILERIQITPNENAVDDYVYCFNALFDHVDYFVVNVSSPNTPNLRALQDKEPLTELITTFKS